MSSDCLVWLPATRHRRRVCVNSNKIRDKNLKVSVLRRRNLLVHHNPVAWLETRYVMYLSQLSVDNC